MLKTFPAKVLLFGEYTILNGSRALALPYSAFFGRWSFDNTPSEARDLSRKSIAGFIKESSDKNLDLLQMTSDMEKGLWFDSSIPHGFGLGSSGALIAAIYQQYGKVSNNLIEDKESLARLEDYFHGSSSGLDPLVSHIQRPLLIHSFSKVDILDRPLNLKGFFLLNTGRPRQTGPLVSIYEEKMKDPQFKQGCAEILAKDVNFAIESLLNNDQAHLAHHLWHISKFQWDFFPEMIPTQMRGLWSRGLETNDFILKLCGAGGGGFLLGYSQKFSINELRQIIDTHEIFEL
ncbi:MAG: mevalonate kinase [Bacteriovoracaceae bacterium]